MRQEEQVEFELSQEELQNAAISGGKNDNAGLIATTALGATAIAGAVAGKGHYSYKAGKAIANNIATMGSRFPAPSVSTGGGLIPSRTNSMASVWFSIRH
jgi:hypothetical protein